MPAKPSTSQSTTSKKATATKSQSKVSSGAATTKAPSKGTAGKQTTDKATTGKANAKSKAPSRKSNAKKTTNGKARKGDKAAKPEASTGPVIVGVGASAGGLEALMQLLEALPQRSNVAVIVVQHLEPHHRSRLAELLGKNSPMPVQEVKAKTEIQANQVYVIPPNADLAVKNGHLEILKRSEGQSRLAVIDKFFASLAEDAGTRAMGVVLSGTGSDGAAGLKEIKEAGGITFAQDPESAAYRGMPDAAVRAGVVDFVLRPNEIAQEVLQLLKHPYVAPPTTLDEQMEQDIPNLEKVHILLRNATGVDFGDYKVSTFKRRLLRRMALRDVRDPGTYIEQLRKEPEEVQALYSDALIGVTSFFREPETFKLLREKVFPTLAKIEGRPIRIWIPGCSTGEEVYSIAMSLLDYLGEDAATKRLQFFATDLNEASVHAARQGNYKDSLIGDVPQEFLRRYCTKSDDGYLISKRLRDMCVFSVHDVYRDPPFSNVDLISCRNVLIYFRPDAQKRALTAFHYALRNQGTLILGSSESTGQLSEYFTQVDGRSPIFRRKEKALPLAYSLFRARTESTARQMPSAPKPTKPDDTFRQRVDQTLLGHYVPPGVVADRVGQVREFIGHTREYLEPAPGRASLNIYRMARRGLELDLRAAIMQAQETRKPSSRRVRWTRDDKTKVLDIEAVPLTDIEDDKLFAITFQEVREEQRDAAERSSGNDAALDALENELERTREQLRSTVEQYETTTEELRTSNEEALLINEELQSTNEELQTTAEELQSANEELSTLNEELQNRNKELTRVNSDLENLLTSVRFPIVFLGQDLTVRRFTPAAENALRLIGSDVGRPIGDIRIRMGVDDLEDRIRDVIDNVRPMEREVQDDRGRWSLLRIQPYRTVDNRIDGAVLVIFDITDLKKARDELERSNQDLHQFAAFTSHELRSPLRNAKMYLGMVERRVKEGDPDGGLSDLRTASTSLDRLLGLIDSLLRFSEVQPEKRNHKLVNLEDAVATATAMLGIDREPAKCSVSVKRPADKVWADEALLGVVLNNLISNAMQHAKEAPAVTLASKRRGDMVEVTVKDNGPGMNIDPSVAFELFQRGDSQHDGVGMGLAVTRRIIEAHGGSIRATTGSGGTTFRFTLPSKP